MQPELMYIYIYQQFSATKIVYGFSKSLWYGQ